MTNAVPKSLLWHHMTDGALCRSPQKLITSLSNSCISINPGMLIPVINMHHNYVKFNCLEWYAKVALFVEHNILILYNTPPKLNALNWPANFQSYARTGEQLHVKLLAAVTYTNPKILMKKYRSVHVHYTPTQTIDDPYNGLASVLELTIIIKTHG